MGLKRGKKRYQCHRFAIMDRFRADLLIFHNCCAHNFTHIDCCNESKGLHSALLEKGEALQPPSELTGCKREHWPGSRTKIGRLNARCKVFCSSAPGAHA